MLQVLRTVTPVDIANGLDLSRKALYQRTDQLPDQSSIAVVTIRYVGSFELRTHDKILPFV